MQLRKKQMMMIARHLFECHPTSPCHKKTRPTFAGIASNKKRGHLSRWPPNGWSNSCRETTKLGIRGRCVALDVLDVLATCTRALCRRTPSTTTNDLLHLRDLARWQSSVHRRAGSGLRRTQSFASQIELHFRV